MFGFLIGNKYLAIAKWIAIAGAVWYIFHTWDKAQNYDAVNAQLQAELKCQEKSQCAATALEHEKDLADKVQQTKDAVQADNDRQEAKRKADDEIAAQHNADNFKQLKSKLDQATLDLIKQAASNNACNVWLHEIIPCTID